MPRKTKASTSKRAPASSLIGKQFRSAIADCNALWEVKSARGRGAYICEVVNEPFEVDGHMLDSDFAGERKTFGAEEIRRALAMQELFAESFRKNDDFYNSLALGQIVHYDNGFGNFVRCEVVTVSAPPESLNPYDLVNGSRALKEVALVGAWRDYDLEANSHHMRGVREGRVFRPHFSCIWENPQSGTHKRYPDPSALEPLAIRGQQEMFG